MPAALAAAALLIVYALVGGTPYQEAKAISIAAPLAMLIAVRPLLEDAAPGRSAVMAGCLAFGAAAAASTALALVNGPVGPATYSPKLTEIRPTLDGRSTLVLASAELLADEHGRDYLVWELRGGRVCVGAQGAAVGRPASGRRVVGDHGRGRGAAVCRCAAKADERPVCAVAAPAVAWRVRGVSPHRSGGRPGEPGERIAPRKGGDLTRIIRANPPA